MEIRNLNFELTESIEIVNADALIDDDGNVLSVYDFVFNVSREDDGSCDSEEFVAQLESNELSRELKRKLCERCESACEDKIDLALSEESPSRYPMGRFSTSFGNWLPE